MRSYNYDNGTCKVINDPLASVTITASQSEFGRALTTCSFRSYGSPLLGKTGSVEVYARNHEKLSANRQEREFPYDFLCVLTIAGANIRVWMLDLAAFLLFLTEIEAHLAVEPPDNPLAGLIGDPDIQAAISLLPTVMGALRRGEIEITVKPPEKA